MTPPEYQQAHVIRFLCAKPRRVLVVIGKEFCILELSDAPLGGVTVEMLRTGIPRRTVFGLLRHRLIRLVGAGRWAPTDRALELYAPRPTPRQEPGS